VPPTPEIKRFPMGFVMYAPGTEPGILFRPTDPQRARARRVSGGPRPTRYPKLGFDSHAGWFAYVMPHDQAFVKRYASPRERGVSRGRRSDALSLVSASQAWSRPGARAARPRNNIAPGRSASYTEHWYLLPHKFPGAGGQNDLGNLAAQVERERGENCATKSQKFEQEARNQEGDRRRENDRYQ